MYHNVPIEWMRGEENNPLCKPPWACAKTKNNRSKKILLQREETNAQKTKQKLHTSNAHRNKRQSITTNNMAYISANGELKSRKKFTIVGFISGLVSGIFQFFSLFVTSITGSPTQIQTRERMTTTARPAFQRNRMKGSNIRTVRNLGVAHTPCSGGG
mmetsp:Transcript_11909/g.22303  ORF Transcript_11909/g.22303 Transcript_11909/m.22303 type:complete len:158 (+) Transcript_11909:1355-1828(+)